MKPRILLPLLVFALLVLWFWGREPGATALGSPDTGGDRQAAEPRAGEKAAAQRPQASPTADARSELAPGAAPGVAETGGLRILLRWHDATPAPGIRLLIRYLTGTRIYPPVAEKRSDEDGVASWSRA